MNTINEMKKKDDSLNNTKHYKTSYKILVCSVPIVLILLLMGGVWVINTYSVRVPGCWIYQLTGIYCPGCGLTRSVKAIAGFDIIMSLREHFMVIPTLIIAALFYIEYVFRLFGKTVRFPLLHKWSSLWIFIGVWVCYAVLRNFIPCIAPV